MVNGRLTAAIRAGKLNGRLIPMMHQIWTAVRSIFAVVAGIVAMTAMAFAVEIPVRVLTLRLLSQSFPEPSALDSHIGWMLSQSLYTLPALILGGYVAAWLAPKRGLAHAIAMATVQELLIVLLIFNPPHPVPPWMWAITLTATPIAIVAGGILRIRHVDSKRAEPLAGRPAAAGTPAASAQDTPR
jgi:hypothetical protein